MSSHRYGPRVQRLERVAEKRPRDGLSTPDKDDVPKTARLSEDDPERLAQILQTMKRAGMLERPPEEDDTSPLAALVRLAVADGLVK